LRTSGLFTTCTYTIRVKSLKDEFFIVPFSDVHHGHKLFCESTWRDFAYWAKHHPTAHFIGNGDYEDSFRAHTRDIIEQNTEADEQAVIHEANRKRLREFESAMAFMRGRLIGVGDGNHDWRFADGRNTAQIIAEDFGAEYLGVMAAVRIVFEYQNGRLPITYVQHHGRPSGAQTAGGKFNHVERMARSYDADIVATGDDHKKGITQAQTRVKLITASHGQLIPREYTPLLVRTGGCKKILEPGVSCYEVDRGYAPLALGFNAIRAKITRTHDDDGRHVLRFKLGAYDII
jgi:hypothetical protein